jgi:hypothetical protein
MDAFSSREVDSTRLKTLCGCPFYLPGPAELVASDTLLFWQPVASLQNQSIQWNFKGLWKALFILHSDRAGPSAGLVRMGGQS